MTTARETSSLTSDICIIGAGSGGLSVAAGTSQLGLQTILIERDEMGGDCLNTGCVPSKALLSIAKEMKDADTLSTKGLSYNSLDNDYVQSKAYVQNVIEKIAPHDSVERFEGLGVQVIKGSASFINNETIHVCSDEQQHIIKAKYVVIATGSRPQIPPIEGIEPDKIFTNETIFALKDKPEHLAIIGGGPIGIEMAYAHAKLGCKVSVFDIGRILPKDDPDLVNMLKAEMIDLGIKFFEHTNIDRLEHHSNQRTTIQFQNKKDISDQSKNITVSHILVAAGRTANLEHLKLENTDIRTSKTGIKTDQRLRTSQKHIFAIGDVAGGPQFTHIAGYHAGIVIRNICFKIPAKIDYSALPWVTYTSPELAHCGMTLVEAKDNYNEDIIDTHYFDLKDIDRAIAENKITGGIKIILNKKNRRILGVSILAPQAGEMIGLWSLAISKKMKLNDIASLIIPYPTFNDLSKRGASSYFSPYLFSNKTRMLVRILQKIPFLQ